MIGLKRGYFLLLSPLWPRFESQTGAFLADCVFSPYLNTWVVPIKGNSLPHLTPAVDFKKLFLT